MVRTQTTEAADGGSRVLCVERRTQETPIKRLPSSNGPPQDRRDGTVRPTDGPVLRQDGVCVVADERTAQYIWDRQVVNDEEGHRDDPCTCLEPQRDGTASA